MSTRKVLGRLGAVLAVAGALSFAVPGAASAAPFVPGSMSTCAPGAWLTFNAERVGPDRIRYTTAAPFAQWNAPSCSSRTSPPDSGVSRSSTTPYRPPSGSGRC